MYSYLITSEKSSVKVVCFDQIWQSGFVLARIRPEVVERPPTRQLGYLHPKRMTSELSIIDVYSFLLIYGSLP